MPHFVGKLQELLSTNVESRRLIGKQYRFLIADPRRWQTGPSYDAFCYPDNDNKTYFGPRIWGLFQMHRQDPGGIVRVSLRSLDVQSLHQFDVLIPVKDIRVSQIDDNYVKLGATALLPQLEITNWPPPRLYASAPQQMVLTVPEKLQQLGLCYDPAAYATT